MTLERLPAVDIDEWTNAKPFPLLVVDDIWDPAWLSAIADEFPAPDDSRWITYPDPKEYGKRCGGSNCWGPETQAWIDYALGSAAVEALEDLTCMHPLTGDTLGGGMHMTSEGGRLAMHTDFNIHNARQQVRVLNLLVFLNPGWQREWGGTLYLGEHREVEVVPEFNRTVVFSTLPSGNPPWHGHPEPIVGEHLRKSLAVYYYLPMELVGDVQAQSTVWQPEAGQ